MQKRILPLLLTPCLSCFSSNVMALTCGEDASQNIISSNNYIFQIFDYIDSPVKNIKQETRTTTTTLDNNVPISTAKHTLKYDHNGLITQSKYDLYSAQNQRLYSEHLHQTNSGWENIIEDVEDKTTSVIQFNTDAQGRIVSSQRARKASDFVFIEADSFQYDNNNCLINKNAQWKLKEIDVNGKFTGVNQEGTSECTFEYKDNQLANLTYNFSNNMKNESTFLYQFDNNKHLSAIQTSYLFDGKDLTENTTRFLSFNDKNDWLSASKITKKQESKHTNIIRELTYY